MTFALLLWFARIVIHGSLLAALLKNRGPLRLFFLSLPLGMAVTSCLYFFWLLIHGPGGPFLVLDIPLLALFLILLKFQKAPLQQDSSKVIEKTGVERFVSFVFLPAVIVAALIFVFLAIQDPHGQWDAWATWNLRARYLFRAQEHWRETFDRSVLSTNPDYPLLIPASIAQGWHLIGRETQLIPVLVAFLFASSTAGILYTSLNFVRGSLQARLACLILICSPFFLNQSTAQFADIPIGCFYLLTILFVFLANHSTENKRSCYIMAGLSAGFAAWTKNEGFLFLLSVLIACAAAWILRRKERYPENTAFVLLGSIPGIATTLLFKFLIGSSGYLLSKGYSAWIEGLKDPARWSWITKQFAVHFLQIGKYQIWLPAILVVYALLVGIRRDHLKNIGTALSSILICVLGYYLFYLVTPLAYGWQIRTSLERLFLQILPSLIFLFFVVANLPQEKQSSQGEQFPAHT